MPPRLRSSSTPPSSSPTTSSVVTIADAWADATPVLENLTFASINDRIRWSPPALKIILSWCAQQQVSKGNLPSAEILNSLMAKILKVAPLKLTPEDYTTLCKKTVGLIVSRTGKMKSAFEIADDGTVSWYVWTKLWFENPDWDGVVDFPRHLEADNEAFDLRPSVPKRHHLGETLLVKEAVLEMAKRAACEAKPIVKELSRDDAARPNDGIPPRRVTFEDFPRETQEAADSPAIRGTIREAGSPLQAPPLVSAAVNSSSRPKSASAAACAADNPRFALDRLCDFTFSAHTAGSKAPVFASNSSSKNNPNILKVSATNRAATDKSPVVFSRMAPPTPPPDETDAADDDDRSTASPENGSSYSSFATTPNDFAAADRAAQKRVLRTSRFVSRSTPMVTSIGFPLKDWRCPVVADDGQTDVQTAGITGDVDDWLDDFMGADVNVAP